MLKIEDGLLMIIDAQGNLARVVAESQPAISRIQTLIRAASILELPLLLTAQSPHKIGHTIEEIASLLPEQPELARATFSVLADEGCRQALEASGRRQLLLCGFETHICVYQSAADLLAEGYDVAVIADAVSSRHMSDKQTALHEISRLGGCILSTEMALFALLRKAADPRFKAISALIK
ncbi:MAG: isochorismatase family protein [Anaerolineaceae bacterium]